MGGGRGHPRHQEQHSSRRREPRLRKLRVTVTVGECTTGFSLCFSPGTAVATTTCLLCLFNFSVQNERTKLIKFYCSSLLSPGVWSRIPKAKQLAPDTLQLLPRRRPDLGGNDMFDKGWRRSEWIPRLVGIIFTVLGSEQWTCSCRWAPGTL